MDLQKIIARITHFYHSTKEPESRRRVYLLLGLLVILILAGITAIILIILINGPILNVLNEAILLGAICILAIAAALIQYQELQYRERQSRELSRHVLELKHDREILEQNENRLKLLVARMPIGCVVWNTEFCVVSWNPAAEKIFGYSLAEAVGRNPYQFILAEKDRGLMEEIWSRLMEGDSTAHSINENLTRDGRIIICEWSNTPLKEANGQVTGVLSMVQDITQRKHAEIALSASEARYRNLFSRIPAALYLTSLQGQILDANPALVELLGYPERETLLNVNVKDIFIDARDRDEENALAVTEGVVRAFRLRLRRFDGRQIWVRDTYRSIKDTDGNIFYEGGMEDITQQVLAEEMNAQLFEKAQRNLSRLEALRQIDIAITATLDLRVSLGTILDQAIVQTGVDAANVLVLNPHTYTLDYVVGKGFRTKALQNTHLRFGEGYAGRAALEQKILNVPDLRLKETDLLRSPYFLEESFVSYYAVPLIAMGEVKGVLEVFHRKPFNPDKEWLDFLEALAGQAAIAIDSVGLFKDLQRSNQELITAYDATIEGWSRALDLRDRETEGHTLRVTEMTLRLAREMGVNEIEQVHMRRGAMLHDIGKMGIPDSILLKPGPLTEGEWQVMRKHPIYAYEMLIPINYLRPALDIPYCHHEKWDGTGYPRGLKGNYIPIVARIFAIVDVWDALCSERPYRPALSKDKAHRYIQEQSGLFFDPNVANAFFKLVNGNNSDLS